MVKSTGNEKSRITVTLSCLANPPPPNVILKRKTIPKDPMPAGIIVRVQENGWMKSGLLVDRLKVVWARRPRGLRRRRNMLVLDAFQGNVTEEVKKQVKEMNSDLVIILGGMTSQLHISVVRVILLGD